MIARRRMLVFQPGREEFGMQVLKVREIVGIQDITATTRMPAQDLHALNILVQ